MFKIFNEIKVYYKENKKSTLTIYLILRFLVIVSLILQIVHKNFDNAFLCILTLILFTIPYFIDKKLHISLPNTLETIIYLFIFSAEILGEIQNFYGIFKSWDTILHTINGFLCAAIGFSLIDILNRNEKFHIKLSPIFVALVAFCFSMTIGVLWEFFEFGADTLVKFDMQKDTLLSSVYTVELNPEKKNEVVKVEDIDKTVIYHYDENNNLVTTTIEGGYLDVGIRDTMKDLLVNFIGAIVFSFIGLLYIKDRDGYKFAERFIPRMKNSKNTTPNWFTLTLIFHI